MVTCLTCNVCLMTIAMMTCGGLASDETCADFEFEGFTNRDTIRVKRYSYINLTFHLDTSKCLDSGDSFWLKVSAILNEYSDTFCIIIMQKPVCSATDGSSCQCLSEPRGWARMFRYLNVSGQVSIVWMWHELKSKGHQGNASIVFNVFDDFHSEEQTTIFKADGADLEFTGFRDDETVRILVHSNVDVTFHLNASTCAYSPEWLRVKLESTEDGFNVGVCNIVFQGGTCNVKDQSDNCRCLHPSSALVHKKLDKLGRVVYIWSLIDSIRNQDQKKTQITFNVVNSDGSSDELMTTPAGESEKRSKDINVNNIILYTSGITAAVIIIITIAIVLSVYVYRRRKGLPMIVLHRLPSLPYLFTKITYTLLFVKQIISIIYLFLNMTIKPSVVECCHIFRRHFSLFLL